MATSAYLAPTWRTVAPGGQSPRAGWGEGAGEALLAPCPWNRCRRTMYCPMVSHLPYLPLGLDPAAGQLPGTYTWCGDMAGAIEVVLIDPVGLANKHRRIATRIACRFRFANIVRFISRAPKVEQRRK